MPIGLLGGIAAQAAGQATGGAIAMGLQRLGVNYDQRKQLQQQQKLQALQISGEKELMDFQNEKQLQMWKDTSYGAQKEQMKLAGINPALMYGMGGGGGQTAGGGIPSVGGASAQSPDTAKAAVSGAMGMGIMTGAQLELMKAQTRSLNVNSDKTQSEIPNVPLQGENIKTDTKLKGTQIESITQGIQNAKAAEILTKAQTQAVEIANEINEGSKEDQIATWANRLAQITTQTEKDAIENRVNSQTIDEKIKIIKANAIGAVLDNVLKGTQNQKLIQDIKASVKQLMQEDSRQRIEMAKAGITKMLGERGLDIAQQGVILGAIDKVVGLIGNATK